MAHGALVERGDVIAVSHKGYIAYGVFEAHYSSKEFTYRTWEFRKGGIFKTVKRNHTRYVIVKACRRRTFATLDIHDIPNDCERTRIFQIRNEIRLEDIKKL